MQAQLDQSAAQQAAADQQAAVDKAVADALAQQAAASAPAAPPAAGAGDDLTAQLQKLVDMKTQGLLTDEEFAAMKSKLIGA